MGGGWPQHSFSFSPRKATGRKAAPRPLPTQAITMSSAYGGAEVCMGNKSNQTETEKCAALRAGLQVRPLFGSTGTINPLAELKLTEATRRP